MKRVLRAYRKTVSIVNESSVALFEDFQQGKKAFLLESYDKTMTGIHLWGGSGRNHSFGQERHCH